MEPQTADVEPEQERRLWLGHDLVERMRLPGPSLGRPRLRPLGSIASSSQRFAASMARSAPTRRMLQGPSMARVPSFRSASTSLPRWWHPELVPAAAAVAVTSARARAGSVADLPRRGLAKAIHRIPDQQTWVPGGIVAGMRPAAVPVRRLEAVVAAGAMLMSHDRARLNSGNTARNVPPPTAPTIAAHRASRSQSVEPTPPQAPTRQAAPDNPGPTTASAAHSPSWQPARASRLEAARPGLRARGESALRAVGGSTAVALLDSPRTSAIITAARRDVRSRTHSRRLRRMVTEGRAFQSTVSTRASSASLAASAALAGPADWLRARRRTTTDAADTATQPESGRHLRAVPTEPAAETHTDTMPEAVPEVTPEPSPATTHTLPRSTAVALLGSRAGSNVDRAASQLRLASSRAAQEVRPAHVARLMPAGATGWVPTALARRLRPDVDADAGSGSIRQRAARHLSAVAMPDLLTTTRRSAAQNDEQRTDEPHSDTAARRGSRTSTFPAPIDITPARNAALAGVSAARAEARRFASNASRLLPGPPPVSVGGARAPAAGDAPPVPASGRGLSAGGSLRRSLVDVAAGIAAGMAASSTGRHAQADDAADMTSLDDTSEDQGGSQMANHLRAVDDGDQARTDNGAQPDASSLLDDPAALNRLVDEVVDRIEVRVVDELERRGRRHIPGVF